MFLCLCCGVVVLLFLWWCGCFFPQIAKATGVLTSNRGEGDEPLWRIGRGTRVTLRVQWTWCHLWGSGRGAIAGCHCSVMVEGGEGDRSGCGAIAGCHCKVLWLGEGEGDDQFWGSAWCHCWCDCRVPLQCGGVRTNFRGVDVVLLQGAIVVCYGWEG